MNQRLLQGLSVALCALLLGCAQVPKESVELSATLGRDLQDVQRSHRKAVDLLFDHNAERIQRFLDDVAAPTYIRAAIDAVGARLAVDLRAALAPDATPEVRAKAFDEMRKIVKAVNDRIARQRAELMAPLEQSRRASLQELDMAYAEMQRANAVLTAHLSSVTKVNAVQDEALAKLGLKGLREKVGEESLLLNGRIGSALDDVQDLDKTLATVKDQLSKLKK